MRQPLTLSFDFKPITPLTPTPLPPSLSPSGGPAGGREGRHVSQAGCPGVFSRRAGKRPSGADRGQRGPGKRVRNGGGRAACRGRGP